MSNDTHDQPGFHSLTRLEPILDRFEAEWRSGKCPELRDYLAAVPDDAQVPLFRELLMLELGYRRDAGATPQVGDYLAKFPLFAEQIRQCVAESAALQPTMIAGNPRVGQDTAQGKSTIAQYTIETELGRGGFGCVYRACDANTGQRVALKVLLPAPSLNPKFRELFLREARIVQELNHPHLVAVHEIGEFEGLPYVAFELMEGGDLAQWLLQNRPTPREAVTMFLPVVDAVGAAHRAGLIHRDLKPANILLSRTGACFVGDFGLAATDWEMITEKADGFAGSLRYMAPEQLSDQGRRVGERTDIFALGIILYELLTGEHPWPFPWKRGEERTQAADYCRFVCERQPKSPRSLVSGISHALAEVCLCALQTEPSARYIDIIEFRDNLRQAGGVYWNPPGDGLSGEELINTISRLPPGPGLEPRHVRGTFAAAIARAVYNYDEALAIVENAASLVHQVDPGAIVVEEIHLPPSASPIIRFWTSALTEACLHGPRMLFALLSSIPKRLLTPEAIAQVSSLENWLRQLEN